MLIESSVRELEWRLVLSLIIVVFVFLVGFHVFFLLVSVSYCLSHVGSFGSMWVFFCPLILSSADVPIVFSHLYRGRRYLVHVLECERYVVCISVFVLICIHLCLYLLFLSLAIDYVGPS